MYEEWLLLGGGWVSECVYDHSPSEATILINWQDQLSSISPAQGDWTLGIADHSQMRDIPTHNSAWSTCSPGWRTQFTSHWSREALHRPVRNCMRSTTHTDEEPYEKHYRERWGTVSKTLQGPDEELYEKYYRGRWETVWGALPEKHYRDRRGTGCEALHG
jgi:hypothetical protein